MDAEHKNFRLKVGAHKLMVRHISSAHMDDMYKALSDGDDDNECLGACCFRVDGHEIMIDRSLSGSRYVATVIHEVVELLNNLYDLGLEHSQISTMGEALTQLFGDNRKPLLNLIEEI